jgi:hypothetical protein
MPQQSVFSMTFFNWQNASPSASAPTDNSTDTSTASSIDSPPVVSRQFWIYWACSIPLTLVIVLIWFIWERRREKRYEMEDLQLERGVEEMEMQIQSAMRKRTMSKVATWDTKGQG